MLVLALAAIGLPVSLASAADGFGTFHGVASCAGSTCHGRAEGNGEVVRQDEIASWQEPSSQSGAHSRAYAALLGERARRIAASLGLTSSASAGECLGCHATFAPDTRRGPRFQISDGVGCESCHGASSGWIASHYAKPATHEANLAGGMIPLEDPRARAGVCLDCHYGGAGRGQFVTHAMMAAGHPRLSFELELFSALQQHHDADADYQARKGSPDAVQLWAVGQAEAVRRATGLFAEDRLAQKGLFPELYFFDCHSCHRPIGDGPAQPRTFETNAMRPIPFANPPFNDENLIMLSAVAQILAPGEAREFDSATAAFHRAMGEGRGPTVAAARGLGASAAKLSAALAAQHYDSDVAFRVIDAITGRAILQRFTDYAGSAQAVMAVDGLLNALVREGRVTVGAAAGIRADINLAYTAVRNPREYNPAQFRAALGKAAAAIEALR